MSINDNKQWYASSDDDFGLSKEEQREISSRALGEHLWEGIENIFGPMKLQRQLHSVSEFEKRFPDHPIKMDEDDDPYVSHKVGDWEGRYFDGPYIDLHHKKYGPMECINLQGNDGETHKLTQDEFRHEVEHFVKHDAQQYVDSEEGHRHSSKNITHKDLLDSQNKGIDLIHYTHGRQCGATHQEILDAHSNGINLNGYSLARDSKANHKETLDAHSKGVNLDNYAYARYYGATHKETLDAHSKGIRLNYYNWARDSKANHDEILDAQDKNIDLRDYVWARHSKATHQEVLDAHSKGINVNYYGYARDSKATHKEVLDAVSKGIDLSGYGDVRHSKATHQEILDAHSNGINLNGYSLARDSKANHDEILDAHSKGVDLRKYGILRGRSYNHDEALENLIPDYNPWDGINWKSSSKWYLASPGGTCLGCGTPLSNRMDSYCPTCTEIMSQSNDMDYMQINPNHPEARPFQKPHDFSGNE